jgi:hypothetical protein
LPGQWDEGLIAAVERIPNKQNMAVDPTRFIEVFDRHEHALEGREAPSLVPVGFGGEPAARHGRIGASL